MKEENATVTEAANSKTGVKLWEPKPITIERAEEICHKLAVRLNNDAEINLLLELVLGLSVGPSVLEKFGEVEMWNYHDERGLFCAMELHKRTGHGSDAVYDYVTRMGIAQEYKSRKEVSK